MCTVESDLGLLGTHSAKASMLSWMSKVGAQASIRRLLGYHVEQGDRTMLVYSRDAAAEPLRQLMKMLLMVRMGVFNPDSTRSGMLSQVAAMVGFYESTHS